MDTETLQRQLAAANATIKAYAEQNGRFANFIQNLSQQNAHYYGLAASLLASGRRCIESNKPAQAVAEFEAVMNAIRAELDSGPDYMRGICAFAAERVRQVTVEGCTTTHDINQHTAEDLAAAARSYMNLALAQLGPEVLHDASLPQDWPWSPDWWKPSTPQRNMEKAGALLAAAYDRHQADLKGTAPV